MMDHLLASLVTQERDDYIGRFFDSLGATACGKRLARAVAPRLELGFVGFPGTKVPG